MIVPQADSVTSPPAWWREHPRYYPFSAYLRERFPCRVYKVTIDAGFTCPNRDGTRGIGGCTYCINESFSPNARAPRRSVGEQVAKGMTVLRARYRAEKFIAYFQAYSNTYAPLAQLRRLYEEAVAPDDVVGLSIGTRPDCVDEEVLDLVADFAQRGQHVWIEYGLQSMHRETLDAVNRGHHFEEFADAVRRTRRRGINVCVHVILGLPGETRDMMMATADVLARLDIQGIKLHHLYIARGAGMEQEWRRGGVETLEADDYAELAASFLERLPGNVAAQRLVGDVSGKVLLAPKWSQSKQQVLEMITAVLASRNSWQGRLVEQRDVIGRPGHDDNR